MIRVNAEWSVHRRNSSSHYGLGFSPDKAVISLGVPQRINIVQYYSLLYVLYLGENSNPDVTRVSANDEPLSRLPMSKDRNSIEVFL
jgi:hypothetical protein